MNKAVTKSMLRAAGIPVVDDLTLRRSEYEREGVRRDRRPGQGAIRSAGVTPSRHHSARASASSAARPSQSWPTRWSWRSSSTGWRWSSRRSRAAMEINCAVLGRPGAELRVSVCEQPLATGEFLSFEDKYLPRDGAGKDGGRTQGRGDGGDRPDDPGADLRRADRAGAGAVPPDVHGDRRHRRRPGRPAAGCRGTPVRQRAEHDPRLVRLLPVGARRAGIRRSARRADRDRVRRARREAPDDPHVRLQPAGDAGQGSEDRRDRLAESRSPPAAPRSSGR